MSRTVRLTIEFEAAITDNALWWADHRSTEQARRWYTEVLDFVETLADDPERFPVAAESQRAGAEVREMLFSIGRRPTHRILFRILSAQLVEVLSLHHVRQAGL